MAREIKDTPVLTGENARNFEKMLEENKHKKVPEEDYNRAMEAYKIIMANSPDLR